MSTQHIGLLIIGDEILSGKRQDKHLSTIIRLLDKRGMELSWARIIGDEPDVLQRNLEQTFEAGDIVFSCGGIGATPDDRTRQCAAKALALPLEIHPQGREEMQERFGSELNAQRLKLVEFPRGARIIPNPVNRVPGFSLRDHHFVPGFPNMAWPMIEWVLDERYEHLQEPGRVVEKAMTVWDARESDVIPFMEQFVEKYPTLRLSCLPGAEAGRYVLELGLRGSPAAVQEGWDEVREAVERLGFSWELTKLDHLGS